MITTKPGCDMSTTCLVLARHGQTTLNAGGRLRGHLDPDLDDVGRAEVAALGGELAALMIDMVISSPLRRAVATAEAIAQVHDAVVVSDQRLIDRDYRQWNGHSRDDVVARFGTLDAAPGVESAASVLARAREVLDEQVDHVRDHGIVLVAHDVVNRLLIADATPSYGQPDDIPQRTGCYNLFTLEHARWTVTAIDQKPTHPGDATA